MNRTFCLVVTTVFFGFSLVIESAQAQFGPPMGMEGPDGGGSGDKKSTKKPPKPKVKMTFKLPDQYKSKDKDHDGQIGLYEWDRKDLATFRRLDVNRDGFLSAQELIRGPGAKRPEPRVATVSSESATPAEPPAAASGTDSAAGEKGSDAASPAAAPSAPATPDGSGAERAFAQLDKDKDGVVSEKEWEKSLSMRPKFEKANVQVNFPLSRDEFTRQYEIVIGGTAK